MSIFINSTVNERLSFSRNFTPADTFNLAYMLPSIHDTQSCVYSPSFPLSKSTLASSTTPASAFIHALDIFSDRIVTLGSNDIPKYISPDISTLLLNVGLVDIFSNPFFEPYLNPTMLSNFPLTSNLTLA